MRCLGLTCRRAPPPSPSPPALGSAGLTCRRAPPPPPGTRLGVQTGLRPPPFLFLLPLKYWPYGDALHLANSECDLPHLPAAFLTVMPKTMKAVWVTRTARIFGDFPIPEVGANEVLIKSESSPPRPL